MTHVARRDNDARSVRCKTPKGAKPPAQVAKREKERKKEGKKGKLDFTRQEDGGRPQVVVFESSSFLLTRPGLRPLVSPPGPSSHTHT